MDRVLPTPQRVQISSRLQSHALTGMQPGQAPTDEGVAVLGRKSIEVDQLTDQQRQGPVLDVGLARIIERIREPSLFAPDVAVQAVDQCRGG